MTTAKIHIHKLIQDAQEYGSDDEYMISRVFFDLEIGGQHYKELHAIIKQTVGSSFETGPLEISMPVDYEGPFNYDAFCIIVEEYYRSLVGAKGSGIHIEGGSHIRMQNNTYDIPSTAEFDVDLLEEN